MTIDVATTTTDDLVITKVEPPPPKKRKINYKENGNSIFQVGSEFNGYQMHFLKRSIIIKLSAPIILSEGVYNMKMDLTDSAFLEINNYLTSVKNELFIHNDTPCFINAREAAFYRGMEMRDNRIEFYEAEMWLVVITLQGYKVAADGVFSPIWKITRAHTI
jgi:hypothetical protein